LTSDNSRLAKFIDARNTYLRGLAAESDGHEALAIDNFVESARISEDFTAGYSQCLSKASVWSREQPEKARELLQRLSEAQPSRTIAHDMLIRMKSGNP
jgi:hypothetical protein